ncbi:hypothetical protein [Rhizomonospora bruguierae]|uniref:hypothetical protein n=1 Tax=Rhizomonospora bruguierae TaxID=1581705 RepID=UPI001BD017D0|nr:hypothetical protein [Micromonospora sp. NBRC 107566]
MSTFTMPTRGDFAAPNELIVHVPADAEPDFLGRLQFTAFWLTDQQWVPGGVQGQVFRTNLVHFTGRAVTDGHTVRVVRLPEVTR